MRMDFIVKYILLKGANTITWSFIMLIIITVIQQGIFSDIYEFLLKFLTLILRILVMFTQLKK